ncbi:MAG: PadR family transcriptional regulator [Thermoplasmata archaeon]|nr:PadR family transcriptional regulator [Thermoplasmata archaeon]
MLELAILGLLKEQPLHGYELKKRLGEALGFLWGVSYGSLYPALRRLESSGAIASAGRPATRSAALVPTGSITGDLAAARLRSMADRVGSQRRIRKAYGITPVGEELLVSLLLAEDDRGDDEKGFALKLAFCRYLPDEARLALLRRRRATLAERLEQQGNAGSVASTNDRYTRSLLEHRARSTRRDLEWIDELIVAEQPENAPSHPPLHGIQEGATA